MTFLPDPKKSSRRIVNPRAVFAGKVAHPWCAACGRRGADGHHVLPKDRGGDDVEANVVSLCGSGTSRCHGAHHGNPYVENGERRDAEWVNVRIGRTLDRERPDTISYLVGKLGNDGARVFLEDAYSLVVM